MANDPALDLLQVLQDERLALLAADLTALDGLLPRKEAALAAIPQLPPDSRMRLRIDQSLRHNQHLLLAVRDGLAQTLDLLRGVARQPAALTYGPDGKRKALEDQGLGLSRKF